MRDSEDVSGALCANNAGISIALLKADNVTFSFSVINI